MNNSMAGRDAGRGQPKGIKSAIFPDDDSGFYLSPAYDLLPDIAERREHALHFDTGFHFAGLDELVRLGKRQSIRHASDFAGQIKEALMDWENEFKRWSVPAKDIERLSFGIRRSLKKC